MAEQATNTAANAVSLRSGNHTPSDERRLALEVRSRKFGFAMFRGSVLMDWGVRAHVDASAAVKKLRLLLNVYAPSVVITRRTRRVRDESSKNAASALQKIRSDLKRRSVPLMVLNRDDVEQFFAQHGCRTKHDIASQLAAWFSELKWNLPRPRKPWHSEAYSTAVFDAIATTVAGSVGPPP